MRENSRKIAIIYTSAEFLYTRVYETNGRSNEIPAKKTTEFNNRISQLNQKLSTNN